MSAVPQPGAGEYKRRIVIRVWADVPNAAFGVDQTFDEGLRRWAKKEPVHSLAIRAGAQTGEVPTHFFWVRYGTGTRPEDITTSHVIEHDDRRYRVLGSINVDDADVCTRIEAKDIGAIG